MEISQEAISNYKIKKVLKISIFILLFFIISLLIFEYFRIAPLNVRFSNITSNSITLNWSTRGSVKGSVVAIGKGNSLPILLIPLNKQKNYDSRDIEKAQIESIESIEQRVIDNGQDGLSFDDFEVDIDIKKVGEYTTHHVKIKNLKPETQYSFLVGDTILFRKVIDISGISIAKTTAVLENLKTPSPTYGAVLNAENKSELAISELKPVVDGVVYLNLYDKDSDKKSNILSAPLNMNGKWYIDISNAVDSEGNDFVETYSFEGVNMYYELEVDAGKLGNWKTIDFASALSPSVPFILNSPDTLHDINIPGSVVKINSSLLDYFVSITSAKEGDCAFSKYCVYVLEKNGQYVSTTSIDQCGNASYIQEQLNVRKCQGESPELENKNLECSGMPVGSIGYNNNQCFVCTKQLHANNYYIARWVVSTNHTVSGKSCLPTKINEDVDADKICYLPEGCYCALSKTTIPNSTRCTDGIITEMTKSGPCTDWDNCTCNKQPLKKDSNCIISNNIIEGDGIKDQMIISNVNRTCTDIDDCICIWNSNTQSEIRKEARTGETCKVDGTVVKIDLPPQSTKQHVKNNQLCLIKEGCYCEGSREEISINKPCKDGIAYVFSPSDYSNNKGDPLCPDLDGCFCNGNYINNGIPCPKSSKESIGNNVLCTKKEGCYCLAYNIEVTEGKPCTDLLPYIFKESDYPNNLKQDPICTDLDYCICNGGVIKTGNACPKISEPIQCTSTNKTNDPCKIGNSIVLGSWVEPLCDCIKQTKIKGSKCFESDSLSSKNLTYWEGGKKLACVGGVMKEVDTSNISIPCIENQRCEYVGTRERCLSADQTTLLYCHFNTGTWQIEKDDKSKWFQISAHDIVVTPKGEKCNNDLCICETGTDHKLNRNQWCIATPICSGAQGFVCNKEGNTCDYLDSGSSQCSGPINSSSSTPSFKLLSNNLVPKAFAQANETQEFIIDTSTGLISGIESGIYTFEVDGSTYMFFVEEDALESNNGNILIFIDKNDNGVFDEGTDTKVSDLGSKIVISTIQKVYKYQLVQGFNFVSFPFLSVTESARTAEGMLEMLNYLTNGSVYSLAKYDSTWEIVGKNGEGYYSNDFQLIPGQGYVIKVIKNVEVSLSGYPIKFETELDSTPLSLFPGWNLVGLYGSKLKIYTAKSLLQDINAYDKVDFTADIVNAWDQDVQGYEGFVLESENGVELEYGFDYPINQLKSYFIRVQDGTGNWQPKLAE